jgi:hypothetical protein
VVLAASIIWVFIALMLEAESTSETSVNFYQTTRHNITKDGHLQLGNLFQEYCGCLMM